ncbi:MAG: CheR family methyltransferase [Acidobacteriota bacterium]
MDDHEIEHIEIDLFLEGVYRRYGYDFRNYARASVQRRMRRLMEMTGHKSAIAMLPDMLRDRTFLVKTVDALSINVTEMFRDPLFFLTLRQIVIPYLRTFPFIKVWHAGCSSGEEVYSLAILFQEEGLYDRTTFFATDFNANTLEKAKSGIYPLDSMRAFTENYHVGGGKASLSDYFLADHDNVIIRNSLKTNITFAMHNLATDGVFGEMHLVLCRNVLIYFDRQLQSRVFRLFDDSLIHGGMLALGSKESLKFDEIAPRYELIDAKWRLYKKLGHTSIDILWGSPP